MTHQQRMAVVDRLLTGQSARRGAPWVQRIGRCLAWTGNVGSRGTVPLVKVGGKRYHVRRLVAGAAGLDIAGRRVLDRCGNRLCVRADHLYIVDRTC